MTDFSRLSYRRRFDYLVDIGYPKLLEFCSVDREAKDLCNDPRLWEALLKKDFPTVPKLLDSPKDDYIRIYDNIIETAKKFLNEENMANPEYVDKKAQLNGIVSLFKNYLKSLDKRSIRDWTAYANEEEEDDEKLYFPENSDYAEKTWTDFQNFIDSLFRQVAIPVTPGTAKWLFRNVDFGDLMPGPSSDFLQLMDILFQNN